MAHKHNHEEELEEKECCCHDEHEHEEKCCCHDDEHEHEEKCCCHDDEHEEKECCCHDECDDDDNCDDDGCHCHDHKKKEKKHKHHHCACGCHDDGDDDDDEEEEEISLKQIIIAAVFFVLGILINHLPVFGINGKICQGNENTYLFIKATYLFCFFVSYILTAKDILKEVFYNIFHGNFMDEDFLMGIASLGAICIGEYTEACAVMLLFQIGEFLEDKAVGKSRNSINELLNLKQDTSLVKRDGKIVEVRSEEVQLGETIVVKAGMRVPLDGKIVSGKTFVDTSALTGESVPVEKNVGDEVISGSINVNGTIELVVQKLYGESTVSRILELVENAQSKKAKSQKFITKFAKVYTPIVCGLALLVFAVPTLITHGVEWKTWLYRALELLVVSCPCALVISVPLSFFAGIGAASRKGILIKGSNYIELLSKVDTCVFDKTGTLTKGVFQIKEINVAPNANITKEQLLEIATHSEYFSDHPISKSLKNEHHCDDCDKLLAENSEEIAGHGIKSVLNGKTVLVGNDKLMKKENVRGFEPNTTGVGTIIYVAQDSVYLGNILVGDVVKEDAKEAIEKLHKTGIKNCVMLTGDEEKIATVIADDLGIDTVYAKLLPQDKVSKLEMLIENSSKNKKTVCFVGDGINDAPVLTRSDVGIAMGGLGSEAALEASDVVIMDDQPSKVSVAIKIAKKILLNVYENISFALLVKIAIIILCIFGKVGMWVAIFGDVGVTMIAILNSMRLLKGKK